jgi:hypothetical protein
MNDQHENIWKKSWKGPRGVCLWLLIVTIAAFLFAIAMTVIGFFIAPELVFIWAGGFGSFVWRIPGLVPALIGLELMAVFIASVAAAFIFYHIVRQFFCRVMTRPPNTFTNGIGD